MQYDPQRIFRQRNVDVSQPLGLKRPGLRGDLRQVVLIRFEHLALFDDALPLGLEQRTGGTGPVLYLDRITSQGVGPLRHSQVASN